jgi:hypothetical protein
VPVGKPQCLTQLWQRATKQSIQRRPNTVQSINGQRGGTLQSELLAVQLCVCSCSRHQSTIRRLLVSRRGCRLFLVTLVRVDIKFRTRFNYRAFESAECWHSCLSSRFTKCERVDWRESTVQTHRCVQVWRHPDTVCRRDVDLFNALETKINVNYI